MRELVYQLVFFIVTLYILVSSIYYGIYIFKDENNKGGGAAIIALSTFTFIFCNVMIYFRK